MMQSEFEKLIGERIDPSTYTEIVEFVYSWHPLITDTRGKDQIAQIWKLGGVALLRDMLPTARAQQEYTQQIAEKHAERNALETELNKRIQALRSEYGERIALLNAQIDAMAEARNEAFESYAPARSAVLEKDAREWARSLAAKK